jgi:Protein of unknown function (DUF3575)
MRHTPTVLIILAMSSTPALAQTSAIRPPVPHRQILSTNPFGFLVNWYNAEYERKIAPATTLGVSASHFASLDHSNAALVVRWYPQRAALDGFYLGARAGAFRFETYEYEYADPQTYPADPSRRTYPTYPTYHKRTDVHPGVGIEIGYNWLLGPKQNVSLGLGFGLTRILGQSDGYDYLPVLPNPRVVNVGIAF